MAYIADIHDTTYTIETGTNGQSRQIAFEGATHEIDWRQIAPLAADAQGHIAQGGRYTLLIQGRSYEIFARRLATLDEQEGTTYEILLAGQRFEVHVEDERERTLLGSLKGAHEGGEIKVRAPMPGLVLAIPKAAGESVERGETVAVLEAMKMENDLTTPHGGTIKEVFVSQGQTVNQGDILLVIIGS
ncbi:MAG TPA: biotin/lipoyl-containing protein [Ktedonobacteraceae bacterium]|jgi:biotin carboxyl carrier protein